MTMCKQVSCDTCYNAYVNVEYHTQGGSPQAATVEVNDCYFMGRHTPDTYPRSPARRNALCRTSVGPASHVLQGLWDSTRVTPPGGAGMTLTTTVCVPAMLNATLDWCAWVLIACFLAYAYV